MKIKWYKKYRIDIYAYNSCRYVIKVRYVFFPFVWMNLNSYSSIESAEEFVRIHNDPVIKYL